MELPRPGMDACSTDGEDLLSATNESRSGKTLRAINLIDRLLPRPLPEQFPGQIESTGGTRAALLLYRVIQRKNVTHPADEEQN